MTEDLGDVRGPIAAEALLRVKPVLLQTGQRVRIRSGPFRGSEGAVVDCREADRLLIAMDGVQRGVYLRIDKSLVDLF